MDIMYSQQLLPSKYTRPYTIQAEVDSTFSTNYSTRTAMKEITEEQ